MSNGFQQSFGGVKDSRQDQQQVSVKESSEEGILKMGGRNSSLKNAKIVTGLKGMQNRRSTQMSAQISPKGDNSPSGGHSNHPIYPKSPQSNQANIYDVAKASFA